MVGLHEGLEDLRDEVVDALVAQLEPLLLRKPTLHLHLGLLPIVERQVARLRRNLAVGPNILAEHADDIELGLLPLPTVELQQLGLQQGLDDVVGDEIELAAIQTHDDLDG